MMNDWFFRKLTDEEIKEYRQWARENWKPGMEIKEVWHPVVRDEIRIMLNEGACGTVTR
jgi:hypothetical protein